MRLSVALLILLVFPIAHAQTDPSMTGRCEDGRLGTSVRNDEGREFLCVPAENSLIPTVGVGVATPSTIEGGAPGFFTVARAGGPPGDLRIQFSLDGSSSRDDRVVEPAAEVVMPRGQDTAEIRVHALTDLLAEGTETLGLTVQTSEDYTVGENDSAVLDIVDVPPNVVSIGPSTLTVHESEARAVLEISRTGPRTRDLLVALRQEGTAANTDIANVPSSVLIPATRSKVDLELTIHDDGDVEGMEFLDVLVGPGNYLVVSGGMQVTLIDDEVPSVTLTATQGPLQEPASMALGTTTGPPITLTARRSGPSHEALEVQATLTGEGAADAYLQESGLFQFPPGVSERSLGLFAAHDDAPEGDEPLEVALVLSPAYQIASPPIPVTVLDNDAPAVSAMGGPLHLAEKGPAPTTVQASFVRTSSTTLGTHEALRAQLALLGTATTKDFVLGGDVDGNLGIVFGPGKIQANVTIKAESDNLEEGLEDLFLTLAPPGGNAPNWFVRGNATVHVVLGGETAFLDQDGDGRVDSSDNCPTVANKAQSDADGDGLGDICDPDDDDDGLTDPQEVALGTNPGMADTDGDARSDGAEAAAGTNPLDRFSPEFRAALVTASPTGTGVQVSWRAPADSLATRYLVFRSTTSEPIGAVNASRLQGYAFVDTAYPGGAHRYLVQPVLPGMSLEYDGSIARASNEVDVSLCAAFQADQDQDGLCDAEEIRIGTSMSKADTDGDGIQDGAEVKAGDDPLQPAAAAKGVRGPVWGWILGGSAAVIVVVLALALLMRR